MVRNVSFDERICESFYAENLSSLTKSLGEIKQLGEWRFDLSKLSLEEIKIVKEKSPKPLIFTCRRADFTKEYRFKAYQQAILLGFEYIDLDMSIDLPILMNLSNLLAKSSCRLILSYHNFQQTPTSHELEKLYAQSTNFNPDIFKVATLVHSDDDINRLLSLQRKSNKNICFGMGKMASLSRVKSLLCGAAFTYIALDASKSTAPGQVNYQTLYEEYEKQSHLKQPRLAVIGNPISHSKSPALFQAFFDENNINALYEKIELTDIGDFETIKTTYDGCNITAPFKQEVIPFLDELSPAAKKIGAVNTIFNRGGKWYGANTDYLGILSAIKSESTTALNEIKACLVLGAGGAARAAVYAMKQANIPTYILNRTLSKAQALAKEFSVTAIEKDMVNLNDFQLIINTTPLAFSLIKATQLTRTHIVLDAIYPISAFEKLLNTQDGFQLIRGEVWLRAQAATSYELFLGLLEI
jgi:3-dehydroquinate dehydratase/shikimate dehydrogenase